MVFFCIGGVDVDDADVEEGPGVLTSVLLDFLVAREAVVVDAVLPSSR